MTSTEVELVAPQAAEPTIARVLMTPEKATAILAHNPHNRRIQRSYVLELSGYMTEGSFHEIGDTIRLAEDGTLLDGQHRLEAIVESGVSVWVWLVEGLPVSAQDHMDRGRKRSVADVLYIHGFSNTQLLAAAVRWAVAVDAKKLTSKNERVLTFVLTPEGALDALAEHPALLQSLYLGGRIKESVMRYPPSLAVALHYLMSRKAGSEAADDFFDLFLNGGEDGGKNVAKGHPIWQLREQVIKDSMELSRKPHITIAAWTVLAWNKWRKGSSNVGILKYYPPHFPEIEDKPAS